jgi:hypothetical protein
MNPGRFSEPSSSVLPPGLNLSMMIDIKEHVAITIFASTAAESAIATEIFAVDDLFYNVQVCTSLHLLYGDILTCGDKPKIAVVICTLMGEFSDNDVGDAK